MTDSIVARHGVTRAHIAAAERDRVWWADLLFVFLPMALVAAAATDWVTRRVCRAFDPEDRTIAVAATAVLSLVTAGVMLGIANFWSFEVEGWRLHNGHVSNRAFLIPIVTHPWVCAAASAVVCLTAALLRFRTTPLTAHSERRYRGHMGRAARMTRA